MNHIPKDAIVIISQSTPHINAFFGGLMVLRAIQLWAAGAVVDDKRDLEEHRKLKLLVFTLLRLLSRRCD